MCQTLFISIVFAHHLHVVDDPVHGNVVHQCAVGGHGGCKVWGHGGDRGGNCRTAAWKRRQCLIIDTQNSDDLNS